MANYSVISHSLPVRKLSDITSSQWRKIARRQRWSRLKRKCRSLLRNDKMIPLDVRMQELKEEKEETVLLNFAKAYRQEWKNG